VQQLRAQLKRAEQKLDILKSLGHLWPANLVSTYRYIAQRQRHLSVRQFCQVLRVSASSYYAWQRRQAPAPEPAWQVAVRAEFRWHSARYGTRRLRAELQAQGHLVSRPLAHPVGVGGGRPTGPTAALVRAPHYRLQPERAGRPQSLAGPAGAYRPEPNLGGQHHLLAQTGRRLALSGHLARLVLAQSGGLRRTRIHARSPGQRGATSGSGGAPTSRWSDSALRPRQAVFGYQL
jgi:hypothetical protein